MNIDISDKVLDRLCRVTYTDYKKWKISTEDIEDVIDELLDIIDDKNEIINDLQSMESSFTLKEEYGY